MTVSITNPVSGPFAGNGATTAFPFTFKAESAAEVQVLQSVAGATATVVSNTDYTIALNAGEGGTVTFATAPATGTEITIASNPAFTQDISFTNAGAFLPESHDEATDRAAIRDIYLKEQVERSLKVPVGETAPDVVGLADGEGKLLQVLGGEITPGVLPDADTLVAANLALAAANAALATISGPIASVTRYSPRPRRWISPSGMNNPLGLAIDCNGSSYSFSSDPYEMNDWTNSASGITHLYVAPVVGSDANPGTSSSSPWKSLDKVLSSAPDKSVVHFIEPVLDFNAAVAGTWDFSTRKIKLMSDVSIGTVCTSWNLNYNLAFLSWVADGSAYKTTAAINGASVQSMLDRKYLDTFGLGLAMPYLTSSSAVKSAPGSWWWDNGTGTLWVHMIDGRVPDPADGWTPVTLYGGWNFLTDSELVIENMEFGYNGGGANGQALYIRPTTAFVTNNAKVSLRKVKGWGSDGNAIQTYDFDTTVLQECAGSECFWDMFNYTSFISTGTQAQWQTVYEDRCHGHNAGSTIGKTQLNPSNSNNISTAHRGKHVFRVEPSGFGCPNSFIADVHGCYSMNAGIEPTESTKTGGLFLNNYWNQKLTGEGSAGSKMILIGCDGEALSAGRNVFSNWDDTDTGATLGEIHLADWLGSPAAPRKAGTIIKDYETGATL